MKAKYVLPMRERAAASGYFDRGGQPATRLHAALVNGQPVEFWLQLLYWRCRGARTDTQFNVYCGRDYISGYLEACAAARNGRGPALSTNELWLEDFIRRGVETWDNRWPMCLGNGHASYQDWWYIAPEETERDY